jgi:hypothetical protein
MVLQTVRVIVQFAVGEKAWDKCAGVRQLFPAKKDSVTWRKRKRKKLSFSASSSSSAPSTNKCVTTPSVVT